MLKLPDGDSENNPPGGPADATPAPDPFDVASLRLSGDFTAAAGVKKAILSIPVRKPDRTWFVRTHPDAGYSFNTAVIELKEDRETYLVARDLWQELNGESTFTPMTLITTINRQGVLFLWPIRLPGVDGKSMSWWDTAREAVGLARENWCRVVANMVLGGYDAFVANGDIAQPSWPDMPFKEILRVAFKDRYIASADHVVLRKLRGEV